MRRMEGRVAHVSGASSGIGRATAVAPAGEGAAVALVALPGPELDDATSACVERGAAAVAVPADAVDPAAVAAAFRAAGALGPVDAVFNNAGISLVAPLQLTTDEQWARLLETNPTGSFNVLREAARVMSPRGRGAIVSTASELALSGEPGYGADSATKGAILAMTRALAAELAPHGVHANAVCPGAVDTPLLRSELRTACDPAAAARTCEPSIALGRLGRAEEIAKVVVFLLSNDASYATGGQFVVDGGRTSCVASAALAGAPVGAGAPA